MSGTRFLAALMGGDEVQWLSLGKVAKIKNGKDWKGLNTGQVPVYGSGGIMAHVDTYSYDKPTVLIPRKGSITNVFYVDKPFWNVDTIYYTEIDTKRCNPKYLYHFIKTIDLMALDTGSGRPSLTQAILNKLQIPIPCPGNTTKSLTIQAEIVRILDTFTELTAELTAELTDREKQYNYYRDQLLTFDEGEVEWKSLGDETICEIADNKRRPIKASLRTSGTTPYYGANNIQDYVDGFTHDGEYVLVAEDGSSNLEQYSIQYATGQFWANNHVHVVRGRPCLNTRYLFHYLQTVNFIPYLSSKGRAKLTRAELNKIPVPIPFAADAKRSLATQAALVRVLDKFDTLSHSISEGLPREIELRRKQYAYYRHLLFSFPKRAGEAA